jgi:hypothetical protein
MAQANAQLAISMQAYMRATGRSSEKISAALVQLFLNCPAVNPDEAGQEMSVDEFAHTDAEQQARRDQLRVLAALARRDRQRVLATLHAEKDAPTPTQAPAADVEPLMEMVDFCVAPSVTLDSSNASSPPTHPALLSDGDGTDVGGVGSHQTQDTGTETNSASQQTQDAGAGTSTTLVAGAGGYGGMTSTQRAPLRIAGDTWTRQRAREHHDYRSRSSDERTAEPPREAEGYHITRTPDEEKAECEAWNTTRYGVCITFYLIREMDRDARLHRGGVRITRGHDGQRRARDRRRHRHDETRAACGE